MLLQLKPQEIIVLILGGLLLWILSEISGELLVFLNFLMDQLLDLRIMVTEMEMETVAAMAVVMAAATVAVMAAATAAVMAAATAMAVERNN